MPVARCECGAAYRRADRSSTCALSPLPARLDHAGNLAGRGEFAQRDARELEFAVDAARTSGQLAAVADARRRRIARQLGQLEPRRELLLGGQRAIVGDRLEPRPLRRHALYHFRTAAVLDHRAFLRHWDSPLSAD